MYSRNAIGIKEHNKSFFFPTFFSLIYLFSYSSLLYEVCIVTK